MSSQECAILRRTTNFYVVDFRNVGGLVMPILIRVHYADNTSEMMTFPAQIWRRNSNRVSKLIVTDKEIVRLELDPKRQTADVDEGNNHWPEKMVPSRFKLFKDEKKKNPMQKAADDQKDDPPQDAEDESSDEKAEQEPAKGK